VRRLLRTGGVAARAAGGVAALATTVVGATAGLDAQLALLTAVLIVMLAAEQRWVAGPPGAAQTLGTPPSSADTGPGRAESTGGDAAG